jgi:hypothetical protein
MTITNQTSSGLAGVSIYETSLEQKYALGTRTRVVYGSTKNFSAEVVYCKADGDVTANSVYFASLTATTAYTAYASNEATTTSVATATGAVVGSRMPCIVPCVSATAGEYFWAFISGTIQVRVAASAVQRAPLYTTATAGVIDDTPTTHQLDASIVLATVGGAEAVSFVHSFTDLNFVRVS